MLGKVESRKRKEQQRMWGLGGINNSMDMNLKKLWKIVKDRKPGKPQFMGSQRVRQDLVTEQQQIGDSLHYTAETNTTL